MITEGVKIDYVICERPLISVRLSINEEIFRRSCRKTGYFEVTCTISQI